MNSQPPIPPLPGVSAPPIKPLDTTVSLLLYPLVTRGHQRPPPHCGEIQPAYARHGDPYPHPSLPPTPAIRPTPQPRWPSLSANSIDSCCGAQSPPPLRYSNPAFPLLHIYPPPSGTPDWGPLFPVFYSPHTYFIATFTSPATIVHFV